jgi:hypothetical protein
MLNPRVLCRWASGKKVYLGDMSILSIILTLESGCHIRLESLFLREDSSSILSKPLDSSKSTSPSTSMTSIMFVTLGDSIPGSSQGLCFDQGSLYCPPLCGD